MVPSLHRNHFRNSVSWDEVSSIISVSSGIEQEESTYPALSKCWRNNLIQTQILNFTILTEASDFSSTPLTQDQIIPQVATLCPQWEWEEGSVTQSERGEAHFSLYRFIPTTPIGQGNDQIIWPGVQLSPRPFLWHCSPAARLVGIAWSGARSKSEFAIGIRTDIGIGIGIGICHTFPAANRNSFRP